MRIIDISEFKDVYDWKLVKANADMVIIRLGYRASETGIIKYDKEYREHRQQCEAYGIPFSLYFFPTSITETEAIEEADFVASECSDMIYYLPIFADSELVFSDAHGRADKLDPITRTRMLQVFCDRLQSQGVPAGVYASTNWFKTRLLDENLPYSKWVAQYATQCTYNKDFLLWQYTSTGQIPGINGYVDMSILRTEIPMMGEDKAQRIVREAARWIGTKENPANSNNVIFNTDYYGRPVNGSAYPWCCVFVWDVFRMTGLSELFYGGRKTAYCPTVQSYYKSVGRFFSTPQVGDLALFDWGKDKVPDHIGIVEAVNGNQITTIEGNTSIASDDNGGSVMRRIRDVSLCTGFARPAYGGTAIEYSPAVDTSNYPEMSYGAQGAYVNLAQNALTLRGFPCPVTGIFDQNTYIQTMAFQKAYGLKADGIIGVRTWSALFA